MTSHHGHVIDDSMSHVISHHGSCDEIMGPIIMGHVIDDLMINQDHVTHVREGQACSFLRTILTDSAAGWLMESPVRHCTRTMACLLPGVRSIWNLIQ